MLRVKRETLKLEVGFLATKPPDNRSVLARDKIDGRRVSAGDQVAPFSSSDGIEVAMLGQYRGQGGAITYKTYK